MHKEQPLTTNHARIAPYVTHLATPLKGTQQGMGTQISRLWNTVKYMSMLTFYYEINTQKYQKLVPLNTSIDSQVPGTISVKIQGSFPFLNTCNKIILVLLGKAGPDSGHFKSFHFGKRIGSMSKFTLELNHGTKSRYDCIKTRSISH